MGSKPNFVEHLEKSEPVFVKYPEIPHLTQVPEILDSDSLEVYEKLDGGNTQVRTHNGRILTGSRANFLSREEYFRFPWFREFNKLAKSDYSFHNLTENLIIYGEFLFPHTLKYKPEFESRFFLIDLYDLNTGKFIPYESARKRLEDDLEIKNILFLETLAKGKQSMARIKELAMGKSQYSDYGREGVVIKDYRHQKFAKFWRTSVNPSKKGLLEEINKTILSLQHTKPLLIPNYIPEYLSRIVYGELKKSGRKDISLAEISDTIEKVLNKKPARV